MSLALVEMTCDCGVTIMIDVKIVAIESCKYLVLGLAYIMYTTVRASYEVDAICGLAVDIDH